MGRKKIEQWKKDQLSRKPDCFNCKHIWARKRKATKVWHMTPVELGGRNDSTNLVSLCKDCFNRVVKARGWK